MSNEKEKTAVSGPPLPPMGALQSFTIFSIASLAMILGTQYLIPLLDKIFGWETVVSWFVVAALFVFFPLLIVAAVILKKEGIPFRNPELSRRLRFKSLNGGDWLWAIGGIVVAGGASKSVMMLVEMLHGTMEHMPPFMAFEPLTPGRYWILAVWFPYWLFNIMGEEVLWRGVMLPRQEEVWGKWTWVPHSLGWLLFHIAFGWQLLLTLIPMLFIQSYIVQRRQNTWLGVIIHSVINGPAFIAIALGAM